MDELLRITAEQEEHQRKRLRMARQDRDDAAARTALDALATQAADPEVNLMPALLDSVRAAATLGETMETLAGVFGRHVENPVF